MNDTQSLIGKLIEGKQERDAIHIAVAPVVASTEVLPGQHVNARGEPLSPLVGIVDPFLKRAVRVGQQFWVFLYPNTITSLRHDWTHPAFEKRAVPSSSEAWMRAWAVKHTPGGYYDDDEKVDEERAYRFAIEAGENLNIGHYESARDHIDNEWWTHWEAITGKHGQRGEYFSCSC